MELIDPTKPQETPKTPQQIARERYAEWDLPTFDHAGRVKWLSENVLPYIAATLAGGDQILEVITTNDLLPALQETLSDPTLDVEVLKSILVQAPQWDETALAAAIQGLKIRGGEVEDFTVADPSMAGAADQFIRVLAMSQMVRQQLYAWDNQVGFSAFLKSRNVLAQPTYEELRGVFFMHMFFEHMQERNRQLQSATLDADQAFGGAKKR